MIWSSSSLVDSAAVYRSEFRKKIETLSRNFPLWLFQRRKLLILVLGQFSLFFSGFLDSSTSFNSRNLMHRMAWSLLMLSSFLFTLMLRHS